MTSNSRGNETEKSQWLGLTQWPDRWDVDSRRVIALCGPHFNLRINQLSGTREQLQVYCLPADLPSVEAFIAQVIVDESLRTEISSRSDTDLKKLIDSLLLNAGA